MMNLRLPNAVVAAIIVCLVVLSTPTTAYAGPPFLTDDPEVVPYQHAEINFFSQGTNTDSKMAGVLPGVDANSGLLPGLQIHLQMQMTYNASNTKHSLYGD